MRFAAILLSAALLSACQDATQKAEADYDFMKQNKASEKELCDAAGRIAQSYLDRRDQGQYQIWSITRDLHCNADQVNRLS